MELDKPLYKILLNFRSFIKNPTTTAADKEMYVKNMVLWNPRNKSPINIEKITINKLK